MNEENIFQRMYDEFTREDDVELLDGVYVEEAMHDELSEEMEEELLEMLRNMTQEEYNDWVRNQVPYYFGNMPMRSSLRAELFNRCKNYNERRREKKLKIERSQ
tara:strand:- start:10725 stop:11036 length:312 start_codon:yes stop_codon:yes gene_type:complete